MLTLVGAAALACMVICYTLEARSPWFVFAFGLACLWASAYGWLAGAWPFGIGEGLWGLLALRRWVRVVDGRISGTITRSRTGLGAFLRRVVDLSSGRTGR
jgi:hypothetical protein